MPRLSTSRLAAPLCAGVLLAALGGGIASAQTAPAGGLRPTFDDNGQEAARPGWVKPPRRPAPPVGVVPKFGTPPAAGAGRTGFVSTNVPLRRKTPARPGVAGTAGTRSPASASGATRAAPKTAGTPDDAAVVKPLASAPSGSAVAPAPAGVATTGSVPPTTAAVGPNGLPVPPRKRRPPPEEDPFDAVGIRAGGFVLRPAIEVTTGYDTNPARSTAPRGSPQLLVAPELVARSDWERHKLDVVIRGSYNYYPDVPVADRPSLDARATGRIDVTRDTHIDLQGRYIIGTDYPGSPNVAADVAKLPIYTDIGATAGISQSFNRLEVSAKGLADRIDWRDSLLTDGTRSSNADRNYDQYGAQMRVSYELTPGVKPFVDVAADTRIHDLAVDRTGAMRDSEGITAKAGTTFEITRTLTGEIAAGYITRLYKDPLLPEIRAPLFDASLAWAATPLTTIKLAGTTTVDESVVPGVSGVLRHNAGIEVSHALRRWLLATVKFSHGLDDYIGSTRQDHRYLASVALTYKLTRSLQLKGELRQEWLHSNIAGSDYSATIGLIGVRLQR